MSDHTTKSFLDSLSLSGITDRRYSMHKSSATQNRKRMHFPIPIR